MAIPVPSWDRCTLSSHGKKVKTLIRKWSQAQHPPTLFGEYASAYVYFSMFNKDNFYIKYRAFIFRKDSTQVFLDLWQ